MQEMVVLRTKTTTKDPELVTPTSAYSSQPIMDFLLLTTAFQKPPPQGADNHQPATPRFFLLSLLPDIPPKPPPRMSTLCTWDTGTERRGDCMVTSHLPDGTGPGSSL